MANEVKVTPSAGGPPDDGRPCPLLVIAGQLPRKLKGIHRWVVWDFERDGDSWKKPPRQAADPSKEALVNKPATWATFPVAMASYRKHKLAGVGYVLCRNQHDPGYRVTLLDFDKSRNPETGEIDPRVMEIVKRVNSYTEISATGTGLHVLAEGKLPEGGRVFPGVELYDTGRYVALTGHLLPDLPTQIENRQAELIELHRELSGPKRPAKPLPDRNPAPALADAELLAKIRASKRGQRFEQLWAGDFPKKQRSEADQDLCNLLAWWTGNDRGRIESLWLQSGLGQWAAEKSAAYRERTITEAISTNTGSYSGKTVKAALQKQGPAPKPAPTAGSEGGVGGGSEGPAPAGPQSAGEPERDALPLTDTGNAMRFAQHYASCIRYCPTWESWLLWDGTRWAKEEGDGADNFGKTLALALTTQAQKELATVREQNKGPFENREEKDHAEGLIEVAEKRVKFFLQTQGAGGIRDMLKLARSEAAIVVNVKQLDTHRHLLNCPNGTVDLNTGKLRPHSQADMLTQLCPTPYDPDAKCPLWESTLHKILPATGDAAETPGDDALISFLQRFLGLCVSGITSPQKMLVLHGPGSNGKSLIVDVLLNVLGDDYAWAGPQNMVMYQKGERVSEEVCLLKSRRLAVCEETKAGGLLDEAKVKSLTGSGQLTARMMYGHFETFALTHKLILGTNHLPRLNDPDYAIQRRILQLELTRIFWDKDNPKNRGKKLEKGMEADPDLKEKLKAEAPGILAWLVRGFLAFKKGGLRIPESVISATQEYVQSEDSVAMWLEECWHLTGEEGDRQKASELRRHYLEWAEKLRYPALSDRTFGERLKELGVAYKKSDGNRYYLGIKIRYPDD